MLNELLKKGVAHSFAHSLHINLKKQNVPFAHSLHINFLILGGRVWRYNTRKEA